MSAMLPKSGKYMLTFILIAINVAVYAYTSIIGGDFVETNFDVILQYGQVNYFVMYQGMWWQLFTAMFVHASIVHLAGNMLFLLIFGLRAEEMFDVHEYLLIYLLSGLAGNLLSLLFGPDAPPSLGASGAIFGMFGAVAIYMRRSIGQSIMGALLYSFFLLAISMGADVNYLAHIGGLLVGLLIGYLLAVTRRPKSKPTYQYRYSYSTRS
jgi:rhomboid protease GluP